MPRRNPSRFDGTGTGASQPIRNTLPAGGSCAASGNGPAPKAAKAKPRLEITALPRARADKRVKTSPDPAQQGRFPSAQAPSLCRAIMCTPLTTIHSRAPTPAPGQAGCRAGRQAAGRAVVRLPLSAFCPTRVHGRARHATAMPGHWITSSARSSSDCGTAMPSARALFRLMTNSNLVACSTAMSAGVAPLSTLSTSRAERRI